MREYLFELRKKLGLTQAEVTKILREKYGVISSYGSIENGRIWPKMNQENAKVLADIFQTSTEYILSSENKSSGYVGHLGYLLNGSSKNTIKSKDEYNKPLTEDEKAFVSKWLPKTEKAINILCAKYQGEIKKGTFTKEDAYEFGIMHLMKIAKDMCNKENTVFWSDKIKDKDSYIGASIFNKMSEAIIECIRRNRIERNKAYNHSIRLEAALDDESDERNYSDMIGDGGLPVHILVEDTAFFEELYKYLSENQIYACKLLVYGFSMKEIIKNKIISYSELGRICLYIEQILKFGKVRWQYSEMKSDCSGVYFQSYGTFNKWTAATRYNNKQYVLGYYNEVYDAIEVRRCAEYHIQLNDFQSWYDRHVITKSGRKIFTYPLESDAALAFPELPSNMDISFFRNMATGGVRKKGNKWSVRIKDISFSGFDSQEEAINFKKEAANHINIGDFDEWSTQYRKPRNQRALCVISQENNKYVIKYKRKRLKTCTTKKEAVSFKNEADSHILSDDFNEWYTNWKELNSTKAPAVRVYYNKSKAKGYCVVWILPDGGTKHFGSYAKKEEAKSFADEVSKHIAMGDISAWYDKYKENSSQNSITKAKIYYSRNKGTYSVELYNKGHRYRFGTYKDNAIAKNVAAQADLHVERGDLEDWFVDFKQNRNNIKKSHNVSSSKKFSVIIKILKINSQWQVLCGSELLASFDRETLAEQVKQMAEAAIANNSFDEFKSNFVKE